MDLYMGFFAEKMDLQRPHYVLRISEDSADRVIVEGNVVERVAIAGLDQVSVPFDFVTLLQLTRATAARGLIFGVQFTLTPEQTRAIREYALRVRQRPR